MAASYPARANSRTAARPTPAVPPVTTAILLCCSSVMCASSAAASGQGVLHGLGELVELLLGALGDHSGLLGVALDHRLGRLLGQVLLDVRGDRRDHRVDL